MISHTYDQISDRTSGSNSRAALNDCRIKCRNFAWRILHHKIRKAYYRNLHSGSDCTVDLTRMHLLTQRYTRNTLEKNAY
ncbi:hypothetical protein QE152_g29712 [Popillia japonica]|uniref:Reverse transcriptase n=1 Tax=Popillia japonica TaxID=7064 RepID=A0AAW1JHX1_POPJA